MGSVSLWEGKLDHAIRHKNGVSLDVGTRGRDSTAKACIELSLDVGSATLMVDGCNPGCVGEGAAAVRLTQKKRFLCAMPLCSRPCYWYCDGVARGERGEPRE